MIKKLQNLLQPTEKYVIITSRNRDEIKDFDCFGEHCIKICTASRQADASHLGFAHAKPQIHDIISKNAHEKEKIMISSFLLIGQSNMAGRGILENGGAIWNANIFKLVGGRWQTAWEPLSSDRAFAGASLGMAFALEHTKMSADKVGLVPCADGGSSIDEWQKGEPLYDHAVNEARFAMRDSTLKAVLWHQGEADCNKDRAASYREKFLNMWQDMKKDLGIPDIKIYVGALGDYLPNCTVDPNLQNYARINEILQQIASERDDVRFISAHDLTPKDDNLHFDTPSLRTFGKRYFDAFAADHPFEKTAAAETASCRQSPEETLESMKAKKERGEITGDQYDAAVKAYIAKL